MRILRRLALISVAVSLPVAAAAATPAFVGPPGWSHVQQQTATTDAPRTVDSWKLGGDATDPGQTVTFISDATASYGDTLAGIKKNFSDNHITSTVDADRTCQGKQAHVVEFAIGPSGHEVIINRILIPESPGLATITYSRAKDYPFDDDVKKAIETFCSATP
jgi:hypothetical protein